MTGLPYKTIKRILKDNVDGDVSKEGCLATKEFCENILYRIAKASIRELDRINTMRRIHNLPELKRISPSIYLKILNRIEIPTMNFIDGDVGYCHSKQTTTLSKEADEKWYYA